MYILRKRTAKGVVNYVVCRHSLSESNGIRALPNLAHEYQRTPTIPSTIFI